MRVSVCASLCITVFLCVNGRLSRKVLLTTIRVCLVSELSLLGLLSAYVIGRV